MNLSTRAIEYLVLFPLSHSFFYLITLEVIEPQRHLCIALSTYHYIFFPIL